MRVKDKGGQIGQTVYEMVVLWRKGGSWEDVLNENMKKAERGPSEHKKKMGQKRQKTNSSKRRNEQHTTKGQRGYTPVQLQRRRAKARKQAHSSEGEEDDERKTRGAQVRSGTNHG